MVERGRRAEQAAQASVAQPKSKPKRRKGEQAPPSIVAGVQVAKVSEAQLDQTLEQLELPAGGVLVDKIRRVANYFLALKLEEYDQCDACGGNCDSAMLAPLIGEVCPFCGTPGGESVEGAARPPVELCPVCGLSKRLCDGSECPGRGSAVLESPPGQEAEREPEAKRAPPATGDVASCELLALSAIRTDGGTLARAALNQETIAEYAEALGAGARLPPAVVYYDGDAYWLADGHHRWHAHERAERAEMACEVRSGDVHDARQHAAGANDAHGLRRSTADKLAVVRMLVDDERWRGKSSRRIADVARVSKDFVEEHRPDKGPREGADGKTRKQPKPRSPKSPEQQAEARERTRAEEQRRAEERATTADPDRITVGLALRKVTLALDARGRAEELLANGVRVAYRLRTRRGAQYLEIDRERADG